MLGNIMLIFGHRGMPSRHVQENTLLSFMQAIQAGADGIEFDLRLSKDGEIVVGHDKNLSRIAGMALKISDLTVKELKALTLRSSGQILTLNEVTEAITSPIQLDMEIKDSKVVPFLIMKLKTSKQLRDRTIVSSFDVGALKLLKEQVGDVRRLILLHTWSTLRGSKELWNQVMDVEPWAVGSRRGSLTKKRMEWLRNKNVLIAVYDKANSNLATKRIVKRETDMVITYRPNVAHNLLTKIMNKKINDRVLG